MDSNVVVAGLAVAGTMFATYMTYRASRAATAVGAETTALQRALQAEKASDSAKAEAAEAKAETERYVTRLRQVEVKMVRLESRFRYFVGLLYDPYITIDTLREKIPENFAKDVNSNG